ncbi:MAG TPA: NAD(P)-dependent oxidoreductase [Gemmatimonadales bacterium]|jgi:nucleoside-diphosphate-sugar epimerase
MPEPGTILITGAGGFIGRALTEHYRTRGWKVLALVRRVPEEKPEGVSYHQFELRRPIETTLLEGVDVLVHAAYVRSEHAADAFRVNVGAAEPLLGAAIRERVRRLIFVSSLSARPDARTVYGRQKHAIEQLFLAAGQTVIRAGLVIGKGGVAEETRRYLRGRAWIPVVGGGHQPVQSVSIDDLIKAFDAVITQDLAGLLTVAEVEPVTLREFLVALAAASGARARPVSVPHWVVEAGLRLASLTGLPVPIARDSLLGLRDMRVAEVRPSLERLGIDVRPFWASLRALGDP